LDDLAQLRIDVLDGVGGVDHTAHGRREGKKRNHPVAGIAPCRADGREFLPPGTVCKGLKFGLSSFGADGGIDRSAGGRQWLTVLAASIVWASADQVNDAGLQRG